MKKLLITEKPSVAATYAKIFHVSGRHDGYIENDEWIITWCVGHLVTMSYPDKYDEKYAKWSLEDIPFLPTKYLYEVIPGVKEQFKIVKKLFNRTDIDTIYYAGDSGREGIYIQELVRMMAGHKSGIDEKCVWIDSQTEEEIRRGVKEAKPMSCYKNISDSGYMRAIEDYSIGINFSRALTLKYSDIVNVAANKSGKDRIPVSVGRVMTCVLGMIVDKEREIRNFKETPFYKVAASFGAEAGTFSTEWKATSTSKYFESPLLYKDNGFKARETAVNLCNQLKEADSGRVRALSTADEKRFAPLLFNLAELQSECSKLFKISPDETLAFAQELYEKKLTTYPRTDARVLTTSIAKEISNNIHGLSGIPEYKEYTEYILSEGTYKGIAFSKYTDDSKVTDHYAIIPTGSLVEYDRLSGIAAKVYNLIVRRFLSIFYPPAVYSKVSINMDINGEELFTSAKALKSNGFYEIAGVPKSAVAEESLKSLAIIADMIHKGDVLPIRKLSVVDGKTTPPKRYNSGSIILAMENAGQLIEDEELRSTIKGSGIGTSATRAEILKKLCKNGYIKIESKTQLIYGEKLGEMIYEVVAMTVPTLLNPKMTASWELGLSQVADGKITASDYRKKLESFVRVNTEKMKSEDLRSDMAKKLAPFSSKDAKTIETEKPSTSSKGICECPMCHNQVIEGPKGYFCDKFKDTHCLLGIWKKFGEANITPTDVKKLLSRGTIKKKVTFKGKKSEASLIYDFDAHRITFKK